MDVKVSLYEVLAGPKTNPVNAFFSDLASSGSERRELLESPPRGGSDGVLVGRELVSTQGGIF